MCRLSRHEKVSSIKHKDRIVDVDQQSRQYSFFCSFSFVYNYKNADEFSVSAMLSGISITICIICIIIFYVLGRAHTVRQLYFCVLYPWFLIRCESLVPRLNATHTSLFGIREYEFFFFFEFSVIFFFRFSSSYVSFCRRYNNDIIYNASTPQLLFAFSFSFSYYMYT